MKYNILFIMLITISISVTGCAKKQPNQIPSQTPSNNQNVSSKTSKGVASPTQGQKSGSSTNSDIATDIIISKLGAKKLNDGNYSYTTSKFGDVGIKCEGIDNEGKYIVAVRSSKTTEIIKWYHVDIKSGAEQVFYEQYQNGRYGFSIDYPDIFQVKSVPDNNDGIIYSTSDDSTELNVSGINNISNETATSDYNDLLKEHSNASYKKQENNWFVVSWTEGDKIVYQESVVGNSSINTFVIKYPRVQKDYYNPIITHLNLSFETPGIGSSH